MRHARRVVIAMIVGAAVATATSTAALAQQKTVKQCTDEWRANKAENQAKGITEKAYVTQCRAGAAAAPSTNQPAAPAQTATPTTAAPAQKTAKQCTDEWRANRAENQAKGITERAYVAQCRSGTAAPQPTNAPATAPAPAPSQAEPTRASPPSQNRTAAPAAAPKPPPTATAAPTGANQFATDTQAKARCPQDLVVWVNTGSKIYHFSGHKDYGNTKQGAYMCEKDATAAGNRAAKNEKRP